MGSYDAKKHLFLGKPAEKSNQIKREPLLIQDTIKRSSSIFPRDPVGDDSDSLAPVGNIPNSHKKRADELLAREKAVLKFLAVPRLRNEGEYSLD